MAPARTIPTERRHQHWNLSKAQAVSTGGIVTSQSAIAAAARARALAAGGNAVDAAIVTAMALHVTEPSSSSGLGGGGFMLLDLPGTGAQAINSRCAPRAMSTLALSHHRHDPPRAFPVAARGRGAHRRLIRS
ncbi:MAG: gamma-glutamyltransferase [Geminicoccaceae bacterium]